jgi:hypothetical protein
MTINHLTLIVRLTPVITIISLYNVDGLSQSITPDEVIRRAAANEEKLRAVEREYTYRQSILVQTLGQSGSVSQELRRVSDVIYDDLGNRTEKILAYPPSRLTTALGVAKPDFKSLLGVDLFFLTAENLARYTVTYVEQQKLDDIKSYVFDVEPSARWKYASKEDRPFKGRIWIADQDFQIVKVEGKPVTAKDDRAVFPKFECYREYVDEKWWLPSVALADDVLDMKRFDLPIKMEIKYTNYKRVQPRR